MLLSRRPVGRAHGCAAAAPSRWPPSPLHPSVVRHRYAAAVVGCGSAPSTHGPRCRRHRPVPRRRWRHPTGRKVEGGQAWRWCRRAGRKVEGGQAWCRCTRREGDGSRGRRGRTGVGRRAGMLAWMGDWGGECRSVRGVGEAWEVWKWVKT